MDMESMALVNMVAHYLRKVTKMTAHTLELNIMERLSTAQIFSQFKVRTLDKIKQQQDMLDALKITDDEKKRIKWKDLENNQVAFDQKIATEFKVEFKLTKWQEEVLTTALIYSELLDDFSPAFFRMHQVLVAGKK